MATQPRAVVIRAPGTNCDLELVRAFELAGAHADKAHLDAISAEPSRLDAYEIIAFPGGFSYGDDIASGRIFAAVVRERLYPALRHAARRGALMIGVCNGFQVLVQAGLLPGPEDGAWPEAAPTPVLALTDNARARYADRWVGVEADPASVCVWTRGLADAFGSPEILQLPVAHGEGRLVAKDAGVIDRLSAHGQVALRYTDNFNGSIESIAGVCDASGRIFGLMPHPERYLEWSRHPWWTRLDPADREGETPGLRIFRNAAEAAREVETARKGIADSVNVPG